MRDYAKISPLFWTRGSGKKLRGNSDAQVVAFYLVTCPAANMIGVYYQPLVTVAHETGLSIDDTRAAIAACAKADFAHYDEEAELVWVPNMASYQIGDDLKPGDKRRGSILAELAKVDGHRFADSFRKVYRDSYGLEGASKGLGRGIDRNEEAPKAPSQPKRDPREDQDQEQEQEQEHAPQARAIHGVPSSAGAAQRMLNAWSAAAMPGLPGSNELEALVDAVDRLKLDPKAACVAFKRYVATWSKSATLTPQLMLKHIAAVQQILSGELKLDKQQDREDPPPRRDGESFAEMRKRMGV